MLTKQFARFILALIFCLTAETAFGGRTFDCAMNVKKDTVVQKTDATLFNSLSKIASAAYGSPLHSRQSAKEAKFLAKFNNIANPDKVLQGVGIKVPCYPGDEVVDAMLQEKEVVVARVYCNVADCPDDVRADDDGTDFLTSGPAPTTEMRQAFLSPKPIAPTPEVAVAEAISNPEPAPTQPTTPAVAVVNPTPAPVPAQPTPAVEMAKAIPSTPAPTTQPAPAVAVAKVTPTPAPVAAPPVAPTPKVAQASFVSFDAKAVSATDKVSLTKVSTNDAPKKKAKKAKREVLYVRHKYTVFYSAGEINGLDDTAVGTRPSIRCEEFNDKDQCKREDVSTEIKKLTVDKEVLYLVTTILKETTKVDTSICVDFQNGKAHCISPGDLREDSGGAMKASDLPKELPDDKYEALHAKFPNKTMAVVKYVVNPCIQFCLQGAASIAAGPIGLGSLGFSIGSSFLPKEAPGAEPPPLQVQYSLARQSQESAKHTAEITTLKEENKSMRKQIDELLQRTNNQQQLAQSAKK